MSVVVKMVSYGLVFICSSVYYMLTHSFFYILFCFTNISHLEKEKNGSLFLTAHTIVNVPPKINSLRKIFLYAWTNEIKKKVLKNSRPRKKQNG